MPYWKNTRTASRRVANNDHSFDPRKAIFGLELVCETDNIEEDANDPHAHDHALAVELLNNDPNARKALALESEAMREVLAMFRGFRIVDEGHHDDSLVLKAGVNTVEDAQKFFDIFDSHDSGNGHIYLNTPYHTLSYISFHPQGFNGPNYGPQSRDGEVWDWFEEYGNNR